VGRKKRQAPGVSATREGGRKKKGCPDGPSGEKGGGKRKLGNNPRRKRKLKGERESTSGKTLRRRRKGKARKGGNTKRQRPWITAARSQVPSAPGGKTKKGGIRPRKKK